MNGILKCSIKSMTGYGVARGGTLSSSLEIIVRSVNGRFLETRIHLPREFSAYEVDLRKIIGSFFSRGTVDVFISRKARGDRSNLKLYFHEEMAKAWLNASKKIESLIAEDKKFDNKFEGKINLNSVLQLPEVVGFEEDQNNLEQEVQELRQLTQKACEFCFLERSREGEALYSELSQILGRLNLTVQQMQGLTHEVNQLLREKMESRLKTRWSELQLDLQRFQQELALLWDKADITEELGRLKEHLHHYGHLLQSEGSQGKKLDFYTQELLREVNTIGSKSPSAQLTHLVVTAKTEIEKLREQVQNIE